MLKNITNIFSKKKKVIENELDMKSSINKILDKFIKEEILKGSEIDYNLSYTTNKGVIKIETNNKLIAQEIAIRIRTLEGKLRSEKISFNKLLI